MILPVQEAKLAARLGVMPPKAILLFGPPGTGKTSFARGVASRLDWPMIEVHSSDYPPIAAGGTELRELFTVIRALNSAVVFLDEVKDTAGHRSIPAHRALTSELLKVIPLFRQGRNRLLICATNDLSAVDPAFSCPGRFDCVIPVGLPDKAAIDTVEDTAWIPAINGDEQDRNIAWVIEITDLLDLTDYPERTPTPAGNWGPGTRVGSPELTQVSTSTV